MDLTPFLAAAADQGAPQSPQGTTPAPANPATAPVAITQLPTLRTKAEVDAVRAQREELSRQLLSAQDRRNDVAKRLLSANASTAPGLQKRLDVLDNRIAQLESDIDATGRQITSAPGGLISGTGITERGFNGMSAGQTTAVTIVFIVAVLAPIAMAWSRALLRRTKAQPTPIDRAQAERMERLENAVDAIALEMERVSEGQRFLTNVLTSGSAKPLGVVEGQKVAEKAGN